jgi:hypothetical protein
LIDIVHCCLAASLTQTAAEHPTKSFAKPARLLVTCNPDLAQRTERLTLTWTTYEELLEHRFGAELEIVDRASEIAGLKEHLEGLEACLARLKEPVSGILDQAHPRRFPA